MLHVYRKNQKNDCQIFDGNINVSQFYIYASSDKFISNQKAVKEIKKDNTETAVKQLINKLLVLGNKCD